MEVTPPVLVIETTAWSTGASGAPKVWRDQERLPRKYRAKNAASVSTVVFCGWSGSGDMHAFDVRTKSYRGTTSASGWDHRWLQEATELDRGWRYGFTVARVNAIVERLGWDRASSDTGLLRIEAPILALVKPQGRPIWELMGGLGVFFTDGLGDLQALNPEDVKTIVLIDMSQESAGYYNFVGVSGGIGMEHFNNVAVIRAFDASTFGFLGSCIRKGSLGRTTTMSSSGGVDLAAVLRGMAH